MQIHRILHLDGHIDEKLLAKAIKLIINAEPLLGCRFVLHVWRPYWEARSDLDQIQFCSLVNTTDVQQEIYNFMSIPLDPCNDTQVHVRIIRGNHLDTLCIKMNHMVTDGAGFHEFVYMLALTYTQLLRDSSYKPSSNTHLDRNISQIFRDFKLKTKVLSLRQWTFPSPDWGFPCTGENIQKKAFTSRQIGPDIFQRLKEYGHTHKVTINDIVIAAFCRALFKIINPEPYISLKIQTIIDLRRYLPTDKVTGLCNLYSALYPRIAYHPGTTFNDTIVEIRNIMNSMKESNPGLAPALCGEMYFNLGFSVIQKVARRTIKGYFKSGKLHPTISNMGTIDHSRLYFGDISVINTFGFSPTAPSPGILVIFSSFRNKMTFSVSYRGEDKMGKMVNSLLELMIHELSGLE